VDTSSARQAVNDCLISADAAIADQLNRAGVEVEDGCVIANIFTEANRTAIDIDDAIVYERWTIYQALSRMLRMFYRLGQDDPCSR
jgi:hypothetical protein